MIWWPKDISQITTFVSVTRPLFKVALELELTSELLLPLKVRLSRFNVRLFRLKLHPKTGLDTLIGDVLPTDHSFIAHKG